MANAAAGVDDVGGFTAGVGGTTAVIVDVVLTSPVLTSPCAAAVASALSAFFLFLLSTGVPPAASYERAQIACVIITRYVLALVS
jgi:hypothetical protein